MATTETAKGKWLEDAMSTLRSLRDEVRVDLHLASMEAKTRWKEEVEPRIHDAERLAGELSTVSERAVNDALEKIRQFKQSLQRHRSN